MTRISPTTRSSIARSPPGTRRCRRAIPRTRASRWRRRCATSRATSARNLLGLSVYKLGELTRAEEIYRSLIEDHPGDPTLRVNLGLVFLKQNASPDAVRCFETALDLAPDHQKAQNYLGLALAQKGELARAREWFLKAGNDAMADRMAQALQQSPVRGVAESAAVALAAGPACAAA